MEIYEMIDYRIVRDASDHLYLKKRTMVIM